MRSLGDIRHLLRAFGIAAVALAAFGILRARFVPESFGDVGHYRHDSVSEIANAPSRFGGQEACFNCHEEKAAAKRSSSHRGIRCEACHGPQGAHVADPGSPRPKRVREGEMRRFCLLCHSRSISRPQVPRQIEDEEHNPGASCVLCHDPHRPKP